MINNLRKKFLKKRGITSLLGARTISSLILKRKNNNSLSKNKHRNFSSNNILNSFLAMLLDTLLSLILYFMKTPIRYFNLHNMPIFDSLLSKFLGLLLWLLVFFFVSPVKYVFSFGRMPLTFDKPFLSKMFTFNLYDDIMLKGIETMFLTNPKLIFIKRIGKGLSDFFKKAFKNNHLFDIFSVLGIWLFITVTLLPEEMQTVVINTLNTSLTTFIEYSIVAFWFTIAVIQYGIEQYGPILEEFLVTSYNALINGLASCGKFLQSTLQKLMEFIDSINKNDEGSINYMVTLVNQFIDYIKDFIKWLFGRN